MKVPETLLRQIFVTEYGCHLWLGTLDGERLRASDAETKGRKVHRLLWEMTGRDLPDYVPGESS